MLAKSKQATVSYGIVLLFTEASNQKYSCRCSSGTSELTKSPKQSTALLKANTSPPQFTELGVGMVFLVISTSALEVWVLPRYTTLQSTIVGVVSVVL